jgi:thiol:disulfide interchange protein DsbD
MFLDLIVDRGGRAKVENFWMIAGRGDSSHGAAHTFLVMISRIFSILLISLALLAPAGAQFGFLPGGEDDAKSTARLVPEVTTFAAGEDFSVAIALKHPVGWHSYYLNAGGPEMPLTLKWTLPDGFVAGEIQWPTPKVKAGYFGKSFIYEGEPVFVVDLTAPKGAVAGQTYEFKVAAAWQICEESCLDEKEDFVFSLTAGDVAVVDAGAAALFAEARAGLPVVVDGAEFAVVADGGRVTLRADGLADDFVPVDFVPDVAFLKAASEGGGVAREGEAWVVKVLRKTLDFMEKPIPQGKELAGVLIDGGGRGVVVPETAIRIEAKPLAFGRFLPVLGGMFLGGLILNLMPCVFPVIGIKIMGFVQQAGSDRRKIILHGVVFALGVLASFAVLAGILFAVRQAVGGDAIGWGYQLQQPWVVLVLMLLMFALAMNLYGVFEIGMSATSVGGSLQTKQGGGGSFFSGVLATVVATPCSGPFLGAAIGAAIGLPAVQFFSAFTAMALGLATPYLVLSVFPKLIDLLPRPGAWMESFKQAMSFLLFATAGYLLWVYAGLIKLENLLDPVFGLSAVAVAGWIYGRWCLPHRTQRARVIGGVTAVAFAVAGVWLMKPPAPSKIEWREWSPELVTELHAEGRPVFIDFTAQWCATCQVNKKFAYTDEVVALMKARGIVALKADKTRPNPAIDARLEELGRTAIPVNVLHVPGEDPVITPEVIRPGYLLELFETVPVPKKE